MFRNIFIALLAYSTVACNHAVTMVVPPPPPPELFKNPNLSLKVIDVNLAKTKIDTVINKATDKNRDGIQAKVLLSDGTYENNVKWQFDKKDIAEIADNFYLKGLKEGYTKVKVASERNESKYKDVDVFVYSNNLLPRYLPLNEKITFASNKDGYNSVYLTDNNGNYPTQVKEIKDNYLDYTNTFAWSNKENKLVIQTDKQEIIIIKENEKKTIKTNLYARSFIWSPDDSKIMFYGSSQTSGNNIINLYIINSDGSNLIKIIDQDLTYSKSRALWSPDSEKIAFNLSEVIRIYDTNKLNSTTVGYGNTFAWLNNSKQILFSKVREQLTSTDQSIINKPIFKVDLDGSNQVEIIKNNDMIYSDFVTSPDYSKIALIGSKRISTINDYYLQDIYTINLDDLSLKRITDNEVKSFTMPSLPGSSYESMKNNYPSILYRENFNDDKQISWSSDNKTIGLIGKVNIQSNGVGTNRYITIDTQNGQSLYHDILDSADYFVLGDDKIIFTSAKFAYKNSPDSFHNDVYYKKINSDEIIKITNRIN